MNVGNFCRLMGATDDVVLMKVRTRLRVLIISWAWGFVKVGTFCRLVYLQGICVCDQQTKRSVSSGCLNQVSAFD